MTSLLPFVRFNSIRRKEIQSRNPNMSNKEVLIECLKRWDKLSDLEKNTYRYQNIDKMLCSVNANGSVMIRQPFFKCNTCWPRSKNDESCEGCCIVCALKCHREHEIIYIGERESFCDCHTTGKCRCYTFPKPIYVDSKTVNDHNSSGHSRMYFNFSKKKGFRPSREYVMKDKFSDLVDNDHEAYKVKHSSSMNLSKYNTGEVNFFGPDAF